MPQMFGLLGIWALATRLLSLTVYPTICLAPCDARLTVRIEASPANRWLVVQVDGPEFHGSMIQLDGEKAPLTIDWMAKGLRAGTYELTAVLYRAPQGEVDRAHRILEVGE